MSSATLVKRIFAHNIFQANWADILRHCGTMGHGSLIKVMGYILGIILTKFHCMHFNSYLVKLRSSAT